jgi:hypothetical protein
MTVTSLTKIEATHNGDHLSVDIDGSRHSVDYEIQDGVVLINMNQFNQLFRYSDDVSLSQDDLESLLEYCESVALNGAERGD